ncbi:cytochrome P450 [Halorientalis litorea]|uniref:cytochrome P450 n=1 Tax=Halorientalis litorea TaxID=2931977 RepID=UPI001FF48A16|nr:cytochrome P450 [Halorientalis litorea]
MSAGGPGGWLPLPDHLQTRAGNVDPFDWFNERRAAGAVQWCPDRGCWDVFTYDAAERVLSDPETFANEPLVGENATFKDTLLGLDPPEHTRKRGIVESHFRPEAVRDHEDDIRATARQLLADGFDGRRGTADVVSSFAYPLPISTIAGLLGAPPDIREELKAVSDDAIASPDLAGADDVESFLAEQGEAVMEIGDLVSDVIDEKRENPGDDLISDLLAADHGLSYYELLRLCGLLIVAGHVTTTNLIANTVWCLAERPAAFDQAREAALAGDDAALARLVEEVVRFRSPAQMAARVATEDVTVAGADIAAGDPVITWIQAANRDPAVFDDPNTFDPARDPNPNIGFGRGPHSCLGVHLAKLEGRVAAEELLSSVSSLSLVETTYEPVEAPFLHGVQALPVRYERPPDADTGTDAARTG